MLASYARGVQAMLNLPADHPQNWFRNAFTHFMDCPHGNWWFYVWHRGYVGYFEQTIRALSGDASFAMPYWDWTELPQIPDSMFDGVLTPTDQAFEPYTSNLQAFTDFIKPALTAHWNGLSSAQRSQLAVRGYKAFGDLWNDVTGYNPPAEQGFSGNQAFSLTCGSRYLSRKNPKFDGKTKDAVSHDKVIAGLSVKAFYDPDVALSFTSSLTASHVAQPSGATKFSVLEGFPHNKVHNYIGGVGAVDPGPYGAMTNFLSPVDPIFFLHHSNMDLLWDVWTRKQARLGLSYCPPSQYSKLFDNEPFLFFVNAAGNYVGPSIAADYFSTEAFGYDYELVSSEPVGPPSGGSLQAQRATRLVRGTVSGNVGVVALSSATTPSRLAGTLQQKLIAEVTLTRPSGAAREFDVLINAPADVTQVSADSPYYAGTVAFFGSIMPGMAMSPDATFAVPLPTTLRAVNGSGPLGAASLSIRVVPAHGQGDAPTLKAVALAMV
jgi:tyrosinase